jgi:hypothetical protein
MRQNGQMKSDQIAISGPSPLVDMSEPYPGRPVLAETRRALGGTPCG